VEAATQQQTALDERVVEDGELEQLLSDRQIAKGAAGEAKKKFTSLTNLAKEKIEALGLEEGQAIRVGSFRITKKPVPARDVAFETAPTTRLTISALGEDD
jgi:hypothetical protein